MYKHIYMKLRWKKKKVHSRKLLCKIYIHVMQKYNTTLQICTTYFLLSMFCFFYLFFLFLFVIQLCNYHWSGSGWMDLCALDSVIGHNHFFVCNYFSKLKPYSWVLKGKYLQNVSMKCITCATFVKWNARE